MRTNLFLKTGLGAAFKTADEAKTDFESRRQLEVPLDQAEFVLDLHIDGDLVDTIRLNSEGVKATCGEWPSSVEECARFDDEYW
ncbi:MAG: hypothetical protein KY432_07400, partial [Acidobacteria bacterium]|nr:hypothetical protein [Acidobacteriota bacterium]